MPGTSATINPVLEIPGTVIAYAHDHLDQVPEEIIRGENGHSRPRQKHPPTPHPPKNSSFGPAVNYLSVRGSAAG
jgi:hypothetical protein